MMKRFTLTMMGLLLLLGGGVSLQAQTVNLPIKGGTNWEASENQAEANPKWTPSDDGHTSGIVYFKESRPPKYCRLGGTVWHANYSTGTQHIFSITLNNSFDNQYNQQVTNLASGFVLVAVKGGDYSNNELTDNEANWNNNDFRTDGNGSSTLKVVASATPQVSFVNNQLQFELTVEENYDAVYFYATDCNYKFIKIESITRTIITASSVASPMISPASGTYDGDLSVTITKGEGNDKVFYSVSGATTGNETDAEFTTASKTLTLTGTGTITVTAKGVVDSDESDVVTNTYTYGIPDGKETPTVNYYQIVPLTMSDGTTPAYFDFEDGTTLITGTSNINSNKLSIVDCDAAHTTATGSTKCMKINLSDKNGNGNFYDVQVQLVFNNALTENKQYQVHFWTKADASVNNETRVRFQENGSDWTEYNRKDITYNTDWTEYSYDISANGQDCTMMVFDLGKVANNTIYLDDVAVFDVTNGNTPVEFTSRLGSAVIAASAFDNYAAGDYVNLNVTGTPTEVVYKEHAANDENAISNYPSYTALTQTNGNWLIPVTAGMKTNGLTIKGHDMTLSSADIYKKVVLSQEIDNNIASKINNVVVELTRSFVAGTWNTVCLPFSLSAAQATQLFGEGYKLAEFTGVNGTSMLFTTTSTFVPGVPYLVKPTANLSNENPVVLVDVDITAKTPQTVTKSNGTNNYSFTGTFTQKSFNSNEWSTTRFVGANNTLLTPNDASSMKSLRCYFTVPAGSQARSFNIDEEATGVESVHSSQHTVHSYYNLNGQRVAQPSKGLYIVNGKKVVIK